MFRSALLATGACIIAFTPALADGAGGKRLTGLGQVGYTYLNLDGPSSDDVNVYHGSGSALWTWPGKWNVQGDYGFESYRFDGHNTLDHLKLGGGLFWRDQNDYALGGTLHYQSIDVGVENDGVSIFGRGEKYWSQSTLAGYLGYSNYDGPDLDFDGWQLGAKGTYYSEPNLAWKLGLGYGNWEQNSYDLDSWDLNGEVEYLIPDCTTSLYAGLGFGSWNPDSGDDADTFQFGLGLRVHFGTQGSLMDRNRNEPFANLMPSAIPF